MNGPLGFVCFSLGAGLVTLVLRNAANEPAPDARAAVKQGIRIWKSVEQAAGAAQAEFNDFQAEIRAESAVGASREQPRRRIRVEPPSAG